MKSSFVLFSTTLTSTLATATPYFILIGDSTVTSNAGWGDGLLAYLTSGASGENQAVSGTTTASWQSNGRWDDLLSQLGDIEEEGDYSEVIVTMQFGHNDQKSLTTDEYRDNLIDMTSQLLDLSDSSTEITPIIITPITRRDFEDDGSGTVKEDFVEWRLAAIDAAEEVGIDYLDLTTASTDYVNAIREEDAAYYNYGEDKDDETHLNDAGEKVFGRMVADLLMEKRSDLEDYVASNEELSELIADGEFATGDE